MIAACSWLPGLIDEPHETGGLAERRRKTTPAQRAENARQLVEREVKERLNASLPVCADRSSGQAKGRLWVDLSRPGEAGLKAAIRHKPGDQGGGENRRMGCFLSFLIYPAG